ncbi:PREDICTED: zinc finger protein 664-like, partial [Wasmannia auropunctata]|uniref:zinc finger protein 664-like n=1 Tax=Wasmannia auropunctata TaxID=64793 RepID=UPI0005ED8031
MSYKLRCTAVEVDERLRMQLHQKQNDDVNTNKDTNNFSENFLNIKQKIIDEENGLHYQNDTQEIRDKMNIHDWNTIRENIDEISYEKEAVISTQDNETAVSVDLVTKINIVEIESEDVMEASIEQTNSSNFVKNKTANDCQRFSEHQTLEQNEQSFYCHTCKINFEKEQYFKIHMNIHEENTVNCTTCYFAKCSSMYDLFLHKRKKHNMFKNIKRLKYACMKCDRFFAHSSTWENHNKNKCINITDKCCKYCKAKFTTRTKLILHLRKEHQNIQLEHKCNRCDVAFKKKLDLAKHIREIHDLQSPNKLNTKEKYVCKFCSKKFNSCRLWKNHGRFHTEETLSSKCHKSFRSDRLKLHHVQREYKKEYVCDQCGKCFSSSKLKWQHAQRKHKKKEYMCDQCGKCCSSYQSRWVHIQREHKNKEYVCDQCGKCFT